MMETMNISIAKDFCETPAGRYDTDGPFSGERFRTDILIPNLRTGKKLSVNFDGTLGFGSSFLEEAFGGLVRRGFTREQLQHQLQLSSTLATYSERVWRYIAEASARAHQFHHNTE